MQPTDEDKVLASFSTKSGGRRAPHTGQYVNASTHHEAWYEQGASLPPGYEPRGAADPPADDETAADPPAKTPASKAKATPAKS